MATSLASLRKTAPKDNPIILLYGVNKVGKTELACQGPHPVMIQTPGENTPTGVSVDTFGETPDLETFFEHFEGVYADDHEFRSLVIDSADGLNRLVSTYVCKENRWSSIEEPGFGKGHVAVEECWQNEIMPRLMGLRDDRKMNIILIAHAETFRFDSPTTDPYARYQPSLPKKVRDLIQDSAEIIAFINHRVSIVKEDVGFNKEVKRGTGAGVRMVYLDERPGFIAGNRYGMPSEVQFQKGKGWAELAKHLPEAAR